MSSLGRLPAVRPFARSIIGTKVRGKKTVGDSEAHLLQMRQLLSGFMSIEDAVLQWDINPESAPKGVQYHLAALSEGVAKQLWSRGYYIGKSVIDELLFRAVAHGSSQRPVEEALSYVRDSGIHRPGLLIFPLHSFGVTTAGASSAETVGPVRFIERHHGIVFTPQSNSLERTNAFLEFAARDLGINRTIPKYLVEHWSRSRPTQWLWKNPLMVLRVSSFPGEYYENQWFLLRRAQSARAMALMLAVLQEPKLGAPDDWRPSSLYVNNFSTLDIRHYITFYPRPHKPGELGGDCVPMNVHRATLAELSQLAVTLRIKHWRRRTAFAAKLARALETILSESIRGGLNGHDSVRARVARKFERSVLFFCRSFRPADEPSESTINLAIAFELLLTDHYSKGVEERIRRRLRLSLRGVDGTKSLQSSIGNLYVARSQFVHAGASNASVQLPGARRAFVHAFLGMVSRLDTLPAQSNCPIGAMLGEKD